MKTSRGTIIIQVLLALLVVLAIGRLLSTSEPEAVPTYSEFIAQVDDGEIDAVTLNAGDNTIDVTPAEGEEYQTAYPDNTEQSLINELRAEEIPIQVEGKGGSTIGTVLLYALPFLLFVFLWLFLIRRMMGGGGQLMKMGKSKAKLQSPEQPKITFRDVAGVDEATEELEEIKEFLENPKKFQGLGARIPKGVLLYGPPGTGKTLLARAVAGEAGVPFFSISGSDFVEMFVGVGASRVRDLFEQAKQNSPCIIFMDEIDAVGRHRGAGLGGGHDEREQTLEPIARRDGRLRGEGQHHHDRRHQPARHPRPRAAPPGALRPPDHGRPPGPQGPRQDPRRPHARKAPGASGRARQARRPDARLHRRRPVEPGQRGGAAWPRARASARSTPTTSRRGSCA